MKISLINVVFFVALSCSTAYAQTPPKDLQTADSLFKLGKKYEAAGDLKQALPLFESSLSLYQKLEKQTGVGNCFNYIGIIYYYRGNSPKALLYFEKSVAAYKKAGDKEGVASVLNNMGSIYDALGNRPKALDFYKQAIVLQEELGDKKIAAVTTQNIGRIYSIVKDYSNAAKYHNKAYLIFKELKDQKGLAKVLMEVGYISMEQGNSDKALKEFTESLAMAEKIKEKELEIEVISNLGELFYRKLDFQEALYYYNRCLKKAEQIGKTQYKSSCRIAIGNILHKQKKHQEAAENCKMGLTIAEQMKAVSIKKDACKCLYESYKSLNNSPLALRYYEQANALADSLKLDEVSSNLINMEFEKQQLADSIAFVRKESAAQIQYNKEIAKKEKQRNLIIASLLFVLLLAGGLWSRLNFVRKSKEVLQKSKEALQIEKDRSEALLLNILPAEVAQELKEKGSVSAKDFNMASILFTDFVGFTQTAQSMSPQRLVEEINVCFKAFDTIAEHYQIEKIKTIGDAYMAAGGMTNPGPNALKNTVLAGLEMQAFITKRTLENQRAQLPAFEMRVGIHAGPIVAGIVGVKKFQYDVWGDTANTASRMETNGAVGKVNISEALYELLKDEADFRFEPRGSVSAKGKGEINMYFVEKNATHSE